MGEGLVGQTAPQAVLAEQLLDQVDRIVTAVSELRQALAALLPPDEEAPASG